MVCGVVCVSLEKGPTLPAEGFPFCRVRADVAFSLPNVRLPPKLTKQPVLIGASGYERKHTT